MHPLTVVMKGKIFVPGCKHTFFFCKVGHFNTGGGGSMGLTPFWSPPVDELQFKSRP